MGFPDTTNPHAPDAVPGRHDARCAALQKQLDAKTQLLEKLYADIHLRMYLLGLAPDGREEPTKGQVLEWIRLAKMS